MIISSTWSFEVWAKFAYIRSGLDPPGRDLGPTSSHSGVPNVNQQKTSQNQALYESNGRQNLGSRQVSMCLRITTWCPRISADLVARLQADHAGKRVIPHDPITDARNNDNGATMLTSDVGRHMSVLAVEAL